MAENLPAVIQNVETLTAEILMLKRQTAHNIIEIGRRLMTAKEMVGHGNWLPYLQNRVGYKERTAQIYMRIAQEFEANPQPVADLEPSKVYLLLEAPEEDRPTLAEKAQEMSKRELEEAVREANRLRKEAEEAQEIARGAQREAIETGKRLEKATQRIHELETQPAKIVEKPVDRPVIMQDPRQTLEMERLRAELKKSEERYNQLLAQAQDTEKARRELEAARAKVEAMQKRLQRLSVQFDDEGRDQYGGSKLLDALDPLFGPLPKAIAEVRILKRVGVGGPCDDDKVRATVPQLRELADSLETILKDRASRPINITPVEVE